MAPSLVPDPANKAGFFHCEERYGTHAGYVCAVTAAANKAVQQGFLLVSDAQALIAQAVAGNVLVGYLQRRLTWTLLILCARTQMQGH